MKLLIASDIHGDITSAKTVIDTFKKGGFDRILLLGDILYHGPRNSLPEGYSPKEVIDLLNENKEHILAVRGNCDTEVDQMVLAFPILADYAFLTDGTVNIFATHGHKFNTANPPPFSRGDILLHGHTHIPTFERFGDWNIYVNPGSVSLPKENNPKTYMIYENGVFTLKSLSGETLRKYDAAE